MSSAPSPTPSPVQLRQQLLETVSRDLLGPAGGPSEEVDEPRVRDRYLTGMLAPRKLAETGAAAGPSDGPYPDMGSEPETRDDLSVTGPGTVEEGTPDHGATSSPTLAPSSMGMTFCVSPGTAAIRVESRWGECRREDSGFARKKDGSPKLVWKRHPRGGVLARIPLEKGRIAECIPDPECPEVVVRGEVRRYQDHWSVTLFLVNQQVEPARGRDQAWVFQPVLSVRAPDGSAIFEKRPVLDRDPADEEAAALAMLYRRRLEFAVGHGVTVRITLDSTRHDRAAAIETVFLPLTEVRQSTSPDETDFPALAGLVRDMKELAGAFDLREKLEPLLGAYEGWIADREQDLASVPDLKPHQEAGKSALERCRSTLARLNDGIALLESNPRAAEAFRFANRAMWHQRIRTIQVERKRRGEKSDLAALDLPENRSWRVFQLAFILLNLPALTTLDHPDRAADRAGLCDLLWFPTGGGKTEAYLGLAAYTLAIRRLQGNVAGRDGENGMAVLMRYTLRLLTLQQFQRAAALICACEALRRQSESDGNLRWGRTPFRLGLWVGQKTTPNTTEQAHEDIAASHGHKKGLGVRGGVGSAHQITYCPWCGTAIDKGRDLEVRKAPNDVGRTLVFCGDPTGKCLFTRAKSPDEGIPVMTVDEEIYRRLPAMVIATVDKFAQMPWNGKVGMLFGQVDGYCERHGYRCPDIDDANSHPAGKLPAARTVQVNPVRPPDLIIQDELHLISGPLGSLVGLYETVVDQLCSWEVNGKIARPKIIASTATVRKAGDQVHAVFERQVNVFPPHGLDISDSFFALEREPSEAIPGRVYIGVCAMGKRLKAALIRVYVALMAAAQQIHERTGVEADPWMTLVGYFNSMVELGGMRRLVEDDVKNRLGKSDQRGMARRTIRIGAVQELTSRLSATDIPDLLDRMAVKFDPVLDELRAKLKREKKFDQMPPWPLDVILATNMVSVGVDVPRLGVMAVAGQPKTTAEYIQATSRVGRAKPGIVCTVYNWARPRDLSHYETFEHYHSCFYKHVEALSVTPFSSGALARGLTALLVSQVRLRGSEFNSNGRAGQVGAQHPYVTQAVRRIVARAHAVASEAVAGQVRAEMKERVDEWQARAQNVPSPAVLGYQERRDGRTLGLLMKPGLEPWDQFTCLNSLRDVEPMVGLILDDGKLDDVGAQPLAVEEAAEGEEE